MAEQISIPFHAEARDVYVVYFSPAAHRVPRDKDLEQAAARWRDAHLEDPLKSAVTEFARRFLSIGVESVTRLPELPVELLRNMGLGELQERVVRSSTHAVVITDQDINLPPRAGLWMSLASALGIAEMLDGVIFDPDALRIVDRSAAAAWFSPMGLIQAGRHIIVPFSVGAGGLGWMTTRGLQKFGLPDLELTDIPPNLGVRSQILNAVAQELIQRAFRAMLDAKGEVSSLVLDRDVEIEPTTIQRSMAGSEAASGFKVGLHFDPSKYDPPMITVVRPRDVKLEQGEWLYETMKRLLPAGEDPLYMVPTSSDDMRNAHERAVAELPGVKARFAAGLRPGEVVFVKYGFPTPDGGHEFMWLSVSHWSGGQLGGNLVNEPRSISSLRIGSPVTIPEAEVFDWMIRLPHGELEGGYTNPVALKHDKG